jgi:pimeloyl-ACP methyl ester carboxylesterase
MGALAQWPAARTLAAAMGEKLDNALALLNGLTGDYLARTGNGLATQMTLVHSGEPIATETDALNAAYPDATGKVVVLVHGLMSTESIWRMPDGTDYGTRLQAELGYTPLYVRYNSGLPIADNGRALALILESLISAYPVPISELLLMGYSMGGLVVRSACHVAATSQQGWLSRVHNAIYVGTPHRGAPMERVGRVVQKILHVIDDPYTKLIGDIANLRSDGIKDLGDSDIRHEDRARRVVSVRLRDPQHPVPLLPSIQHHLIAGAFVPEPWIAELLGDMVVPLGSATNTLVDRVKVFPRLTHLDVPRDAAVYEQIKDWCQDMNVGGTDGQG